MSIQTCGPFSGADRMRSLCHMCRETSSYAWQHLQTLPLPYPCATQAYGVVLQPGKLSLVTELMRGGDMYHALRNHPQLMRSVIASPFAYWAPFARAAGNASHVVDGQSSGSTGPCIALRWESLGRKVALDIALGLNHLHCQLPPLMHRDLKVGRTTSASMVPRLLLLN